MRTSGTTEFYANVMVCEGADGRLYSGFGPDFEHRSDADVMLRGNRNSNRFRIHVRLKPEGAPKRYASEWSRKMWEAHPIEMRRAAATAQEYLKEASVRWAPFRVAPRTPKIEESA